MLPGDQSAFSVCLQGGGSPVHTRLTQTRCPQPARQTTLTTHTHTLGGNAPLKEAERSNYIHKYVPKHSDSSSQNDTRGALEHTIGQEMANIHQHFLAYCILGPSSALPLPFDTVSLNRKLSSRSGERGAFVFQNTEASVSQLCTVCECVYVCERERKSLCCGVTSADKKLKVTGGGAGGEGRGRHGENANWDCSPLERGLLKRRCQLQTKKLQGRSTVFLAGGR